MNGSEKQVKWATEIQGNMIADCNARIEKMATRMNDAGYDPEYDGKRDSIEAGIEYLTATISDVSAIDSAAWFIDCRTNSIDQVAFLLYDATDIMKCGVNGPVISARVEIIKKYQPTTTRFAKR